MRKKQILDEEEIAYLLSDLENTRLLVVAANNLVYALPERQRKNLGPVLACLTSAGQSIVDLYDRIDSAKPQSARKHGKLNAKEFFSELGVKPPTDEKS